MNTPQSIVVLTDGERNLAYFMDLLREDNHDVVPVARIPDCERVVSRKAPDAVVIRCDLIRRAGHDALVRLKGLRPEARHVVLASDEQRSIPWLEAADEVIGDPCSYEALLKALGLRASEDHDQAPEASSAPDPAPAAEAREEVSSNVKAAEPTVASVEPPSIAESQEQMSTPLTEAPLRSPEKPLSNGAESAFWRPSPLSRSQIQRQLLHQSRPVKQQPIERQPTEQAPEFPPPPPSRSPHEPAQVVQDPAQEPQQIEAEPVSEPIQLPPAEPTQSAPADSAQPELESTRLLPADPEPGESRPPKNLEIAAAPSRNLNKPGSVATPNSETESYAQVLECCRRLTELEENREKLLTTALNMFLEICGAERGSIMMRDARGEHLSVVRAVGFPDDMARADIVPLGSSISGQVALQGKPYLEEHVVKPSRPGYRGQSFMILPIRDWRNYHGVVNITDRCQRGPFRDCDLMLAGSLANQLAANLSNSFKLEKLRHMAVADPLTGLYNRRYFDRQMTLELERARRYDRQVTLVLLDVDRFKQVNDQNGYVVGDMLIRAVAEVIKSCFREVDIVTRWGGDEFAILLPDTGKPRGGEPGEVPTLHVVERVRQSIESEDFTKRVRGLTVPVTISGGVATFPTDSSDRQALFTAANRALHRAKRIGNNRVCIVGNP